jgi:YhcH/YjgK/YiaL family protein
MMNAETVNHDASNNPENWNGKKLNKWFQKGEWRLEWNIIPDESINKTELAIQYFKNRELWEKAFNFLKTSDLKKIDTGKYELQGKDMYVIVDEYITRNEEDSAFEAHRRYIDIQYIVEGEEKIGISALGNTKEITPYDNFKDIIFLTSEQNNYRIASPEKFFVFFPEDAHRPCVKTSENIRIRKVVIKIRID